MALASVPPSLVQETKPSGRRGPLMLAGGQVART